MGEVQVLHTEYPPNSHLANKEKENESTEVRKVIKGEVKQQKRPFSKRFAEAFFGEDVESVGSYIVMDVLIPAIKNTISDMVSNGIEMLMFGSSRGGRDYGRRTTYFNYSNSYRGVNRERDRDLAPRNRRSNSIQDIVCDDRSDAEQVIEELLELLDRYQQVSVADLYDLVGITTSSTDNNWGWVNLSSANVRRVSGGYLIDLPRPVSLR